MRNSRFYNILYLPAKETSHLGSLYIIRNKNMRCDNGYYKWVSNSLGKVIKCLQHNFIFKTKVLCR